MTEGLSIDDGGDSKLPCCGDVSYIPLPCTRSRLILISVSVTSVLLAVITIGAVVGTRHSHNDVSSSGPDEIIISGTLYITTWYLNSHAIQEWNDGHREDIPTMHQAQTYETELCDQIKITVNYTFPDDQLDSSLSVKYSGCKVDAYTSQKSTVKHIDLGVHYSVTMALHGNWSDGDILIYQRTLSSSLITAMTQHNISGQAVFQNLKVDPNTITFKDDVNRCDDVPCHQRCVPMPWDYRCECYTGYRLTNDTTNCTDVDECLSECKSYHMKSCINTLGSYKCVCLDGYTVSKQGAIHADDICIDVDECFVNGSSLCHRPRVCQNQLGSYQCVCDSEHNTVNGSCVHKPCPAGFQLIHDDCIDINECSTDGIKLCPPPQICHNTEGSYYCGCTADHRLQDGHCVHDPCDEGYQILNDTCQDIDECKTRCNKAHQTCHNTPGSYYCPCDSGYYLHPLSEECVDRNECKLHSYVCLDHSVCINTEGSYICNCLTGYHKLANSSQCTDVDECALNQHNCIGLYQTCHNLPGSYRCDCDQGYNMQGIHGQCTDINECIRSSTCVHGTCYNLEGSYACQCHVGFEPSHDNKTCNDIDECAAGVESGDKMCTDPPAIICHNTIGSYRCICPVDHHLEDNVCVHNRCSTGFKLIGDKCQDVDECESSPCRTFQHCLNNPGSYTCHNSNSCHFGSHQQTDGSCTECLSPYDKKCPTGKCTNAIQWCTTNVVCPDGANNKHCASACTEHETPCASGLRCVPYKYWYDNTMYNCLDRSDEVARDTSQLCQLYDICDDVSGGVADCMPGYTRCNNGKQCIHNTYKCDGHYDCDDMSDEHLCIGRVNQMTCHDGYHHYPRRKRCDGHKDCADGGDEPYRCVCLAGQKRCNNGHCVESEEWCNGLDECGDKSDELHCERTCKPSGFKCVDRCIIHARVCDGNIDCDDLSDETHCDCSKPFRFQCDNGACIRSVFRCNGVDDCTDGSDELNCKECEEDGNMMCPSNKQCVPAYTVCDGQRDCPQGEDEHNCTCGGGYECSGGGCIDNDKICDGTRDCNHGDDETKCLHIQHAIQDGGPNNGLSLLLIRYHGKWYPICSDLVPSGLGSSACHVAGQSDSRRTRSIALSSDWARAVNTRGWVKADDGSLKTSALHHVDKCGSNKAVHVECDDTPQDIGCGRRSQHLDQVITAFVIGGTDARPGHWPWQVQLYQFGSFSCGGSIISSRWVVTAGHCVLGAQEKAIDRNVTDYYIKVGSLGQRTNDTSMMIYHISRVVTYSSSPSTVMRHDVALLKTSEDIKFTDYVRPACLPKAKHDYNNARRCYKSGWGSYTLYGASPDLMQEMRVQILPSSTCFQYGLAHDSPIVINNVNMICLGNTLTDSCFGDSGGPMVCRQDDDSWVLLGVTSFGYKPVCKAYHVDTNLTSFTNWIHLQTGIPLP